ncbi:MAG: hypothetical protein GWN64_03870, partial [Candidatus Thorarchaeota archaeon]|nr:hypothetical protein [Candidatus Thorarchaeota archaeon]
MTTRRGMRPKTPEQQLRITPKRAASVTEYRRASLEGEIENGMIREGASYEGSHLNRDPRHIRNADSDSDSLKRSAWLPSASGGGYVRQGESGTAVGAIAHSESYMKRE